MSIKYLVCYDTEINKKQKRAYAPSAATVVKSLLMSLKELDYDIELISFASTTGAQNVEQTQYRTEEGFLIHLFYSFGRRNHLMRALNAVVMRIQYFLFLLLNIKRDDTVIAYHSPYHMNMLRILKRIKRFHLVLQMLEIYADVTGDEKARKKELKLAKYADAFIFPTETLDKLINTERKPSVIMLGTYQVESARDVSFGDDKIHVLYAGTLDPRKGGATAAAVTAAYLPEKYHLHIIGFGSEEEKTYLLDVIKESTKPGCAKVTYDGLLSGEDYIQFLQSCQIGLSTQNPDAVFNATSFPSKILSYMANGLRVVSIRIPAVEQSAVSRYIHYYDKQSPEIIAGAICSVGMAGEYDSRKVLKELNDHFNSELKRMIDDVRTDNEES